jgi:hypothetical protein
MERVKMIFKHIKQKLFFTANPLDLKRSGIFFDFGTRLAVYLFSLHSPRDVLPELCADIFVFYGDD